MARVLGPEVVATLSSIVVVAMAAILASGTPTSPVPTPGATTSSAPSGAATTSTTSPSRSPQASAVRTPAPWAAQATVLLGAEERLTATRKHLVSALAEASPSATGISRELRAMNTSLTGALNAIEAMESSGAPSALIDDLRGAHEATLTVSLKTLQASIQNAPAYQSGATEIVTMLDEISALAERVRSEAGLPSASAP